MNMSIDVIPTERLVLGLSGLSKVENELGMVIATDVYNPASKRLLEKLGAIQTEDNQKFTS